MELANFPSEVLAEITAYTHGSAAIVSLWKCGNAVLQSKLSQCITKLDLKDQRLVSRSRFPKLICSLKNLRSLALDRGNWPLMSSSRQLASEINSLQLLKLETLDLKCMLGDDALELFNGENNLTLPSESVHTGTVTTFWNLTHSFPMLRTLKVAFGVPLIGIPTKDLLLSLPSTLTHLAMPLDDIYDHDTPLMSLLPTDLLHFEATIAVYTVLISSLSSCPVWSNPPPHLHTIEEILLTTRPTSYEFLPRTLTKCELGRSNWTSEAIASLPPGFGNIVIESYEGESIVSFPPLARKVTLRSHGLITSSHVLTSLPKALTSLTLAHRYDEYNNNEIASLVVNFSFPIMHWPPGLVNLHLIPYLLTNQHLEALPTSIKSLGFAWGSNDPIDCSKLPRRLEVINVSLHRSYQSLSLLPGFPNTLTTLCLFTTHPQPVLDSKILTVLPSSLQSLELQSTLESWINCTHDDIKFPASLTSLELSHWPHKWFSLLPSSLRSFVLYHSPFEASFCPNETTDYFEHLPTTLETIFVQFTGDMHLDIVWSGTSFSKLINLKDIHTNLRFDPSIFQTISDKLPKLQRFSAKRISLTPEYAMLIPPHLHLFISIIIENEMKLYGSHWPPEHVWTSRGSFRCAVDAAKSAGARRTKAEVYAKQYPAPKAFEF